MTSSLKLGVLVIIICVGYIFQLSGVFACIISFFSFPEAGKVYYTYFRARKREVERGRMTSLRVMGIANSWSQKLRLWLAGSFLSTVVLFPALSQVKGSQCVWRSPWRLAQNIGIWALRCKTLFLKIKKAYFFKPSNLSTKKSHHLARVWKNRILHVPLWFI